MHGVLEDVDIGFKRFVGMILPTCHQFAEHNFLLVNYQTGEINFCLFVEKPNALGAVDNDNGFLHTVENEAVQPADTAGDDVVSSLTGVLVDEDCLDK